MFTHEENAMDTLLKEVAAVFGSSALFVILVGWLIKILMIETFKRESEKLSLQLRQQADISLEQLKQQGAYELETAKQKLEIETKLTTDLRKEFMTEQAVHLLLKHPDWKQRSFTVIQKKIGGFDGD